MNPVLFLIFTFLCSRGGLDFPLAAGISTIGSGQELNSSSPLVSDGGNFTLGFFTIPVTNYTYLGIWYTNDDQGRKLPKCRSRNDDKFEEKRADFLPTIAASEYEENTSLSLSDCMERCWNVCNCVAFTVNSNGTGCITWRGKLEYREDNPDGVKKYVLVRGSSSKESPRPDQICGGGLDFPSVEGISTIGPGEELNYGSLLESDGGNFTLGFFTIPRTNYSYLGIWKNVDMDSHCSGNISSYAHCGYLLLSKNQKAKIRRVTSTFTVVLVRCPSYRFHAFSTSPHRRLYREHLEFGAIAVGSSSTICFARSRGKESQAPKERFEEEREVLWR
ncbi:hypothetical protein C3L33_09603, partial [Rhododendron williamsianum]